MWQLIIDVVQIVGQVFTMVITGVGAWIAYQMLLKTPDQTIPQSIENNFQPALAGTSEITHSLVVFDTKDQRSTLNVTTRGLECHLRDRRPGKKDGTVWIVPNTEIPDILDEHLWSVNAGLSLTTGKFSVGASPAWQYSKNLFPESRILEIQIGKLLEKADLKTLRKDGEIHDTH